MIELVIAMLICAVITGAITSILFQVIEVSASTNNHMIAVRQAQSAGYWVSHDTLMAQAEPVIVENAGELESITLDWGDWDGNEYQVVYTFGDELQRSYSTTDSDGNTGTSVGIIAEFIDLANTSCQFIDGQLILTVTITVGSGSQAQSETRTYGLVPRPGS